MKITYQLTEEHLLNQQLYAVSNTESVKKKRLRSRFIIPVLYIVIGLYFYFDGSGPLFPAGFVLLGLLWLVFYPIYSRWLYKRHFRKYVREKLSDLANQDIELEFTPEEIRAEDKSGSSQLKYEAVSEFVELKDQFVLRINQNSSSIGIPKEAVAEPAEFIRFIESQGITYSNQQDWEFK